MHNTQPFKYQRSREKVCFYKTRVSVPSKRNLLKTNNVSFRKKNGKRSLYIVHTINHPTHVPARHLPALVLYTFLVSAGGRRQSTAAFSKI